jgi:hypothetical protein
VSASLSMVNVLDEDGRVEAPAADDLPLEPATE